MVWRALSMHSNPDPLKLEAIEALVGPLSHGQRDTVLEAMDADAGGVLALAQRLSASPSVHAPAAVLISALKRNAHRGSAQRPLAPAEALPDPAEVLARLYFAKLDYLAKIKWGTEPERQREAIDYAVGYLPSCRHSTMPEGGVLQLERELLHELGIDPATLPDAR